MSSGLNDGVAVICSKYDRMSSCRLFGISSNTGRKSSIEMPSRATSALTNIRSGSRENSRKIRQGRRRLRNAVRKKTEYHAPHQIDQPILSVQSGSPFPLMFYLLYQLLYGFTTVRTKTFFVHLFVFTLVFSLPLVYT